MDSRWPPSAEEIVFSLKIASPTLETSSSPGLVHLLQVVVVDDPGINAELVLLRLVTSRGEFVPEFPKTNEMNKVDHTSFYFKAAIMT